MNRVNVFIDGDNLRGGCSRSGVSLGLDYEQFIGKLVGPTRRLVRAYYYTAPLNKDAEPERIRKQQGFFSYLDRVPYLETRFGVLKSGSTTCDSCGTTKTTQHQKGVDLRLGVDMVTQAVRDMYDVAVLVTGDGDMVEAVNAVKDLGKHVELAAFDGGLSADLARAADLRVKLTKAWFSDPATLLRKDLRSVKAVPAS